MHGYLQLMGWAGLFIMGVSIPFLSRLAHLTSVEDSKISLIYRLMVSGLILRFIAHSFLPYFTNSYWYDFFAIGVLISAILISLGILFFIQFLSSVVRKMKPDLSDKNRDIRVFLFMNIIGWVVYAIGAFILLIIMYVDGEASLIHHWHLFLVDFFILFSVFPICFGVGLRALPLFMRLTSIKWNVMKFSKVYFMVIITLIISKLYYYNVYIDWFPKMISIIHIIKDILIIWFIYKLNILFKSKKHREIENKEGRGHDKKKYRDWLPDNGEFGKFEWLIQSAFIWLLIGLIFDIISQIGLITKIQMGIGIDGVRHMWLAGFVSLLIMGMAVRMIPGMTGAMKLQKPSRVAFLAIIMNLSVLFRTISIVFPELVLNSVPYGGIIATRMFGASGMLFLTGLVVFYTILKPVLIRKDEIQESI
ncbi:hypothetical protein HN615_07765 [Candidatus Woesearchaeota archaeon]|nr:hypothetical protein [Candidatus Woesearchaeota archaeon]